METIVLKDLGKLGIITDVMDFDLPPSEISDGINIRFKNFKIIRSNGFLDMNLDFSDHPNYQIFQISPIITSERVGIVLMMKNSVQDVIYLFYDGTDPKPRNIMGAEAVISDQATWFDDIYGAKIINPRNTNPFIFDLVNLNLRKLEHWGDLIKTGETTPGVPDTSHIDMAAKILTTFKGFYVALNTQEDGIDYSNRIRWSDIINYPIEPGNDPYWIDNDPSFLGGFVGLPDESNEIITCRPLGDRLVIYTFYSVYSLQYTGDNQVFAIEKLFSQRGAAGTNCVVEYENNHFVINNGQIYSHDGQSIKDIAENRVQDRILKEINNDFKNVLVIKNLKYHEIWVCYTKNLESGEGILDGAAIWNYSTNQWSFLNLPNVSDIRNGPPFTPFNISTAQATYDNTTKNYDDFPPDFAASELSIEIQGLNIFYCSPDLNKLFLGDFGYTANGNAYYSFIERKYIDLDEVYEGISPIKIIGRIIPQVRGVGKIKIKVGFTFTASDPIEWIDVPAAEYEMNLDTGDWKVDVRATGRYLSYKIEMEAKEQYFEVSTMNLEVAESGRR